MGDLGVLFFSTLSGQIATPGEPQGLVGWIKDFEQHEGRQEGEHVAGQAPLHKFTSRPIKHQFEIFLFFILFLVFVFGLKNIVNACFALRKVLENF